MRCKFRKYQISCIAHKWPLDGNMWPHAVSMVKSCLLKSNIHVLLHSFWICKAVQRVHTRIKSNVKRPGWCTMFAEQIKCGGMDTFCTSLSQTNTQWTGRLVENNRQNLYGGRELHWKFWKNPQQNRAFPAATIPPKKPPWNPVWTDFISFTVYDLSRGSRTLRLSKYFRNGEKKKKKRFYFPYPHQILCCCQSYDWLIYLRLCYRAQQHHQRSED